MELEEMLRRAVEKEASDIFCVAGQPISYKINGIIQKQEATPLLPKQTEELVDKMYVLAHNRHLKYRESGDDDFALSLPGVGRFRVNIYRQRGSWSAVLRVVAFALPDISAMNIPQEVLNLSKLQKGLVLVTGTAGSGKSTTISYIIDQINQARNCHILTLEDPIEFLHSHKQSIVSQREINIDSMNYGRALKAAMRESPDVILIGEMRDLETIETAITAAETGHLVLSTLHTVGTANTIDRIIDVFPSTQQEQIRVQLAMVLKAVVSQQLLQTKEGGLMPAFEILKSTPATKTLIREGKVHMLDNTIASSRNEGMVTMDNSILELYRKGYIEKSEALSYAMNIETMKRLL